MLARAAPRPARGPGRRPARPPARPRRPPAPAAALPGGPPLTGGADPTLDLATLPLWPGAVARVHRSFAPAVLGPGSLGGTLVLEPPRPTAPEATDVWAALGSFGEARMRVGNVSDVGGGARVATAFSASRSTDDFSYVAPFG